MTPGVRLIAGDAVLELAPEAGGCVALWRKGAWDVLRPAAPGAGDPREFAGFPMFPFVGRISHGRFAFEGRGISLAPNMPPEPHAIHGQGWQSAWQVAHQSGASAMLVYEHDGQVWPWTYRAEQTFDLAADQLTITLRLTNTSDRAMPGGFGWHPYFWRDGASLAAPVSAVWRKGRPVLLDAASDLRDARDVAGLDLDHAFSVGHGEAVLAWPDKGRSAKIRAGAHLRHLVVYVPPGEDYFCVEPVSHAPDAVNSDLEPHVTGFRVLAPGEAMTDTVRIELSAQDA